VLEVRIHSAEVQDRDGIKLLLDIAAWDRLPKRLSHLWLDAGYTGEAKDGLASSPIDGLDMSGI
jgi:hypothetical protein